MISFRLFNSNTSKLLLGINGIGRELNLAKQVPHRFANRLCQNLQVTGLSYKGSTGQKKSLLTRFKRTLNVHRKKIIGQQKQTLAPANTPELKPKFTLDEVKPVQGSVVIPRFTLNTLSALVIS